jgi:two-component system, NtrC family, response regulator GlrR
MSARVLLVDDDTSLTRLLAMRLASEGFEVHCADQPRAALARAETWEPDIVVSDLCMDGMDGIRLFEALRAKRPALPVILMTAHGSIAEAVRATKLGVGAFLTKPFDGRILVEEIQRHLALAVPHSDDGGLPAWRRNIVTRNPKMNAVLDRAGRVARSDANVLITGPSGSGKEMLARAVHDASPRATQAFVAVNCGAIPENLIESELFGHVKGSFTGAMRDNAGLFRTAHGGTIFLDEIGEMPLPMQVKLLRVLQERKLRPVGGSAEVAVDARVVAATHRDLATHMRNGAFREDLFYRLSVIQLEIPALNERREDVPVLAQGFLRQLAARYQQPLNGFSPEALKLLVAHDWPGNVRQLYNVVEQCVALADGPLVTEPLVAEALRARAAQALPTLAEARDDFERDYLIRALRMAGGQVPQAADLAGRNRTDFYRLLRKHSIEPDDFKGDRQDSGAAPLATD